MMLQCWDSTPDKRPTFNMLYMDTSRFIEEIAGYLEMGFKSIQRKTEEFIIQTINVDDLEPSAASQIIPPSPDPVD